MKLLAEINKLLQLFKTSSDVNTFKNILVVSNTGLGDTLLTTPAIVSLRKNFPELHITFMINKKLFPLFKGFDFVDGYVLYSSGLFSQLKIIFKLRRRKIDTIFLFHSNGPEDIFFSVLSGAMNILKTTDNLNHKYKKLFLNSPNKELKHNIDKKLDLVRIFKPKKIYYEMQIPWYDNEIDNYLEKNKHYIYIGIQLGAQDLYKMWPVDNFIYLAQEIFKKFSNVKFVMFGSTLLEQELVKKFEMGLDNSDLVINLCGKTSIESLPKILKEIEVLVSNDTGTFHLAVALKVKTVSLFGPTDSRVYGPYQDLKLHRVIQANGEFVNYLPKKQRSQEGMQIISKDAVVNAVTNSLKV